jgi:hypothetical protein
MATCLVLHPPSDFVEHKVRELHNMKWVGDLDGVGNIVSNTDRYESDRSNVAQRI